MWQEGGDEGEQKDVGVEEMGKAAAKAVGSELRILSGGALARRCVPGAPSSDAASRAAGRMRATRRASSGVRTGRRC